MTDESGLERWIRENVTLATGQTIAFGASMLGLGIWFGNQITGRIATAAWPRQNVLASGDPSWVGTVEPIDWAALAVFCVGILTVLAIDAYTEING